MYDNITLKTDSKIQALCTSIDCSNTQQLPGQQQDEVIISPPDNPIVPNIIFNIPTFVPYCETLDIDISLSSGSGGRNFTSLVWKVFILSTKTNQLEEASTISDYLSSLGNNLLSLRKINHLIPDSIYYITLSLSNFLGMSSSSSTTINISSNPNVPIVRIIGSKILSLYSTDQLYLDTIIILSKCITTDYNLTYQWIVEQQQQHDDDVDNDIFEPIQVISESKSKSKFLLSKVSPSLRSKNIYKFSFIVTSTSTLSTSKEISSIDSIIIHILSGNIIAQIQGGSKRYISTYMPLILDASLSIDVDNHHNIASSTTTSATTPIVYENLKFQWSCIYRQYNDLYGTNCPNAIFEQSISNQPILSIDINILQNNTIFNPYYIYGFYVTVSSSSSSSIHDDQRSSISSEVLISIVTTSSSTTDTFTTSTTYVSIDSNVKMVNSNGSLLLDGYISAKNYGIYALWSIFNDDNIEITNWVASTSKERRFIETDFNNNKNNDNDNNNNNL